MSGRWVSTNRSASCRRNSGGEAAHYPAIANPSFSTAAALVGFMARNCFDDMRSDVNELFASLETSEACGSTMNGSASEDDPTVIFGPHEGGLLDCIEVIVVSF